MQMLCKWLFSTLSENNGKERNTVHIQYRGNFSNSFIPLLVESVDVEPKDVEGPTNHMHPLMNLSDPAFQTNNLAPESLRSCI